MKNEPLPTEISRPDPIDSTTTTAPPPSVKQEVSPGEVSNVPNAPMIASWRSSASPAGTSASHRPRSMVTWSVIGPAVPISASGVSDEYGSVTTSVCPAATHAFTSEAWSSVTRSSKSTATWVRESGSSEVIDTSAPSLRASSTAALVPVAEVEVGSSGSPSVRRLGAISASATMATTMATTTPMAT